MFQRWIFREIEREGEREKGNVATLGCVCSEIFSWIMPCSVCVVNISDSFIDL